MISGKLSILTVFLTVAQKYCCLHANEISIQDQSQLHMIQHQKTSLHQTHSSGGWEFRILSSWYWDGNAGRCRDSGPRACCAPGFLYNEGYRDIFTDLFMHALNANEFSENDCLYLGLRHRQYYYPAGGPLTYKWRWYDLNYFDPNYPDFPWENGPPPPSARYHCTCATANNDARFGFVVRIVGCADQRKMICMVRSRPTTSTASTSTTTTTTTSTSTTTTAVTRVTRSTTTSTNTSTIAGQKSNAATESRSRVSPIYAIPLVLLLLSLGLGSFTYITIKRMKTVHSEVLRESKTKRKSRSRKISMPNRKSKPSRSRKIRRPITF